MTRRFSRITLVASFLGVVGLGGLALTGLGGGRALAGDAGKCTIATSGDSATAKACAKGGRTEAKKMMKKMVSDAKKKDKSQKFTCEGCHKDLDNYELTKNAKDDFKKLEALLAS
jgi:hypothetical protein